MANKMTIAKIKAIQDELQATFAGIEAKYGYKMSFGNTSYDSEGNFHTKVSATKLGSKSVEAQRYEGMAGFYKLPPLGTEMEFGGKVYKIAGMNTRGTKILAEHGEKKYLLSTEAVERTWQLICLKKEKGLA